MLTYSAARALMESARDKSNGKPLQNNTRLYERTFGETTYYAVQLHSTDVVEIHPNGHYVINTGGWDTVTTWARIHDYAPIRWGAHGNYIGGRADRRFRAMPKASDPEPPYPQRTIPRPFTVPDPGPEPVDDGIGCIADTEESVLHEQEHILLWGRDVRGDERPDMARVKPAPTRALHVLRYLDTFNCEDSALDWYFADVTEVVTYGRESYRYGHPTIPKGAPSRDRATYTQCPHCKAFQARHRAWETGMHGGWKTNGYAKMCELLDHYGSREAWQEAYITEFRDVRAARKIWSAWCDRNYVPFGSSIELNGEGLVPRGVAEAHFKAERAVERERRRRQREHEARERERRQIDRFARGMRRRRKPGFVALANEATNELVRIREAIDARNTQRQSEETT